MLGSTRLAARELVGDWRLRAAALVAESYQLIALLHPRQLAVLERRAQHLLDIVHAYGQCGRDDQALQTLLAAERLAPEEIEMQPASLDLIVDLLGRERRRRPELRALAERVGAVV